ncbi:PAS domain S-box protein [Longibacter salinarum]|nr:PAS domain S-box protein [Longibacter salinarum]
MDVAKLIEHNAQNSARRSSAVKLKGALERIVRMAVRASGMSWGVILFPSTQNDDSRAETWHPSISHGESSLRPASIDPEALSILSEHVWASEGPYVHVSAENVTRDRGMIEHDRCADAGTVESSATPSASIAGIALTAPSDPEVLDAPAGNAECHRSTSDGTWGILLLVSDHALSWLEKTETDTGRESGEEPSVDRGPIEHRPDPNAAISEVLTDAAELASSSVQGYADATGHLRYRRFISESDQGIYRMEVDPPVPTDLDVDEQVDRFLVASRVAECNEAYAQMYGVDSPEEIIGLRLSDLYGGEAEANRSVQRTFIKKGYRVSNVITQEEDQAGNRLYFSNTAFSIIIDGAVHRVWGIQQDVTPIKEAEAALNHSERLLASTIDTYPFATAIFDADLRYLYANDLAAASSDVDAEGMIGKRPEKLYPTGIWEPLLPILQRCREEESFTQRVVPIQRDDGTERVIIATFVPLLGEQGALEAIIASTRDITEERRAKRELRQSEQRLSLHVEHSPLAFVEWDVDGRIVKWNPAAEQIFGYTAREARGLHVADLSPYADREETQDMWRDIISNQRPIRQQRRRNLTKAGRLILCEWSMTPLVNHSGTVIGVAATAQDVTQEIEARESLRQERDLLRGVAETSAAGIIVADRRGRVSFVNTRAETLLRSRRAVLSENFLDATFWSAHDIDGHPFTSDQLPFQRVLDSERPVFDVEMVLDRPGADVILSINAAPLHDNQGNISQVVLVMEDVTERMERQIRIREHNDILSGLAKMLVEKRDNVDEILRYAAQTAKDAFGTDRLSIWKRDDQTDDFICIEVVGPGDQDDLGMRIGKSSYQQYLKAIRGHRAVCSEDVHADERLAKLKAYNDERDIRSTLDAPVRIGGQLVGLVSAEHIGERRSWSADLINFAGAIADVVAQTFIVSKQKRTRAALRRSEQRWKALVEHHPEGVMISIDGQVAYANEAALAILGADSLSDLEKETLRHMVHDSHLGTLKDRMRRVIDGREKTEPWEHTITGLDGSSRTIVSQSVPITYREQPAAQTVMRDVTDRRAREEELRRAKEEAQQMSRLKSTFLANMSHEIRTPLTSIIGFAEVLEGRESTTENDIATIIGRSSQRLLRTLNSVLDLSKLEAGAMKCCPEWVDVKKRTQESVRLFQPKTAEANVTMRTEVPASPLRSHLDVSALDRILDNLIGNAIKFTPEGGHVTVRASGTDDVVTLEVEDTGIGVPDDFRQHLFEPFLQAPSGPDNDHQGTGLGLAITRQLIRLMGGEISVSSTEGVGTCFTVTLPREL